jgi:hypothetical protein
MAIYKAKEGGRMLRLLKLAKKDLFPKAHATAAIKCEGGTVKNPPLKSLLLLPSPIHPTPLTKQRIRASLGTKDLTQARLRRDQLLFASWAFASPEQKRS